MLFSFDDLISIITNREFNTADLQDVRWDHINAELGSGNAGEWLDEDTGWQCTPISLSIPYWTRRGEQPAPDVGPKSYVVGDFLPPESDERKSVSLRTIRAALEQVRLF